MPIPSAPECLKRARLPHIHEVTERIPLAIRPSTSSTRPKVVTLSLHTTTPASERP